MVRVGQLPNDAGSLISSLANVPKPHELFGSPSQNLIIGAKKRITGLRLKANDTEWASGEGPEVVGPMASLLMAIERPRLTEGSGCRYPGRGSNRMVLLVTGLGS